MHVGFIQQSDELEFDELFGKWYAPRAPLCKGSCREATEGLCGTIFRVGKCIGEKVRQNDFAVESSGFNGTSAKWGQKGLGTFERWAHREVHHYNPSVSSADSSPYTGEPLGVRHRATHHRPIPSGSGKKRLQTKPVTTWLPALRPV